MTTPLLIFLIVSSVVTLGSLIWAIRSQRRRSPEGRRRGLQVAAIAAAIVVVGLAASRLL